MRLLRSFDIADDVTRIVIRRIERVPAWVQRDEIECAKNDWCRKFGYNPENFVAVLQPLRLCRNRAVR